MLRSPDPRKNSSVLVVEILFSDPPLSKMADTALVGPNPPESPGAIAAAGGRENRGGGGGGRGGRVPSAI